MIPPLTAEIGIRRLHALCADAVWRKDAQGFGGCYCEDGVWKIAGMEFEGREAIGRALIELSAANERVLMQFGSPILNLEGGVLTGRTFVVEHVKRLDGSAASTIGIYYESFAERDGQWLFQRRHFDFCYFGPPDLSAPLCDIANYGPAPAMPDPSAVAGGLQF